MDIEQETFHPIAKRLRAARLRIGVSQKELGILASIDEFSSSARINQYEKGKHVPDYKTSQRLAKALKVPVTYLYADNDELANFIHLFASASKRARKKAMEALDNNSK